MKFQQLRTNRINQWIIIHLRYLVGFAFIPSGLIKVMGERFTAIQTDNPVGYFFEALYQSGMYWNFLGWVQVIAGNTSDHPALRYFGRTDVFCDPDKYLDDYP